MIRLGVIGLGNRGTSLLKDAILPRENVDVPYICDMYADRVEELAAVVETAKGVRPTGYTDPVQMLQEGKMDAVLLATSWEHHIDLACLAMEKGIAVASEVGGAYNEHELWKLVDGYERTKTPFMFLENCCFGREELMLLNMVKKGVFGEIVHCSGGYRHDLRAEIAGGAQNRHYRLNNYLNRNTENYATHELGPIARLLDINHGNRLLRIVSVASKASGVETFLQANGEKYPGLQNARFQQGDVITSVITCSGGQTITLTLDTTLPRYYSRGLGVHGTKGMYSEDNGSIFLDGIEEFAKNEFVWKKYWGNVEEFRKEYEHPIWQKFLNDGVQGGHGGMDWLVFDAFFEALESGEPMPIDVYDAATWMVVSVLAEQSIATGQAVAFPDFTGGKWVQAYRAF